LKEIAGHSNGRRKKFARDPKRTGSGFGWGVRLPDRHAGSSDYSVEQRCELWIGDPGGD